MRLLYFGTPQSNEIKGESGVISKGWCVTWIHQLIPPDMMMVVFLDLMLDMYIRC